MTKLSEMNKRMTIVWIFVILAFCYLCASLYRVQIIQHEELYAKAKKRYTAVKKVDGKRGEIYDYSGNLLAANLPCSSVCADPSMISSGSQSAEIADYLAEKLKIDRNEILKKLQRKTYVTKDEKTGKTVEKANKYVLIQSGVEHEAVEKLKTEVAEKGWNKIVFFNDSFKRSYPKKQLLANILGFTSTDRDHIKAVMGLEKSFDKNMQSTVSVSRYERARTGQIITYGNQDMQEEKDGFNIFLTIREPLQAILEEELDAAMVKNRPLAAYAIIADPYTGDILAAAQRPTYNPNDRSTMDPKAFRNRIAEDTMEPGSVMKAFTVAGALDLGIVRPETIFDCEGGQWFYGGKRLKDSHKMGRMTVSDIIQQSSNIGTAKIALAMGEKNLDDTLRSFGFGKKTGIPLRPETSGIFRPLRKWDKLSITRFGMGQGIAVSPLQLIRAYCALANGGYLVKLRLVDRVEDPATGKITKIPVERGKCIFRRKETHPEIVAMLKRVTAPGGTASKAAVPGYYAAGKTGTAEKFDPKTHRYAKRYIANFAGFVPADNPKFVVVVCVDEPSGKSYYGGTVSGPVFSAIASKTLKFMNVPPEYDAAEAEKARKLAAKKAAEEKRAAAKREAERKNVRPAVKNAAKTIYPRPEQKTASKKKPVKGYRYITYSR